MLVPLRATDAWMPRMSGGAHYQHVHAPSDAVRSIRMRHGVRPSRNELVFPLTEEHVEKRRSMDAMDQIIRLPNRQKMPAGARRDGRGEHQMERRLE